MAKNMEEVVKGMQDMARQMSGQGGDNHAPVEPVSFRELYTVLPELDGWEKGKPTGFEKRHETAKRGELAVAVSKRFFVTIEGDNIQDNTVLHEVISKMDLGKLAGMK